MSGKKFFVFKTKSGEFIGHMFKPTENDLMYGLEYKTQPVGTVLYKTKDKNGNELSIIENPDANIVSLKDFDEQYNDVTRGIKLAISDSKFSGCVAKLISEYKSDPPAKKTTVKKAAKKAPAKKKSKKKGGAKKKSTKKSTKKR